ncbi:MAG TPA: TadE family protein [Vicinamibacterales bacterium]|nr:TadE family protein [Vicinamibacterales bacterium]
MGLVEMVIAAPLLILLVMGIIEFGTAYNDKISLNQAVRVAARAAALGEFPSYCSTGAFNAKVLCVADRETNVSGATFRVKREGNNMTVCASAPLSSSTPVISQFLDGRTLKSQVTMRVEKEAGQSGHQTSSGGSEFAGWCAVS